MTDDSDKTKKTEAPSTAPRDKTEAPSTAPRPSEDGASASASQVDQVSQPLYDTVQSEWSTILQTLVRTKQATSAVGSLFHEIETHRRLMWVKLTGIEVEGLKATEIARKMEGYVTETCQELRKEFSQLQTQVKVGLARALEVESSIGAQDTELARVTAALEALQKQSGGMATTDDPTGATATTPAQAGAPQNPTQAGQQEATLPSANPWSLGAGPIPPVPPEEFYSWPGSVPPTRPLGASVHQAGPHSAGPSASAHPFATPPHGRDDFSSPALGWPANFAVDTSPRKPVRFADQAWAFVSRTCPAGDPRCWLRRRSELSPVPPPECEPDADELGAGAHPRPSQEDSWS